MKEVIDIRKKELEGGEKLEVQLGQFWCFQCHDHVKVRLFESFPDEPLQPERTWCGTCGQLIGTSYKHQKN